MSTSRHNETDRAVENSAQFAHELANLLDGSMRNVALVRALMHAGGGGDRHDATAAGEADALGRLQTAEHGMRKMAALIKDWMSRHSAESRALPAALPAIPAASNPDAAETLGDAINQARDLHYPAAVALGIDITVHVSANAARLPAGAIFSVLANGLRNSIEAISDDPRRQNKPGLIEVRAQLSSGQVRVAIADNGPGLAREVLDLGGIFRFGKTTKPGGHGLGLALCRDIATGLGGNLRMTNRDEGGAQLTMTYPAASQSSKPAKQQSSTAANQRH